MRIARIDITPNNIVDKNKFAVEIFVCGCKHDCCGCHNPSLHDFNYQEGKVMSVAELCQKIKETSYICDIVIYLGGDFGYFLQEYHDISKFAKEELGMTNILYTGFEREEIEDKFLEYTDYTLFGKYDPEDPDKQRQFMMIKRLENGA